MVIKRNNQRFVKLANRYHVKEERSRRKGEQGKLKNPTQVLDLAVTASAEGEWCTTRKSFLVVRPPNKDSE